MTFPANNLPTASRTWGREVEKKVSNLESSFRSAEVNNVTRDSQLSVTANAALSAATQAQAAADDAAEAASKAQEAIDGLGSLDEATSTFKINAANITVGSLSGNRISGGEIIGTTLKTASTGRRLEITATTANFFDENGANAGSITGVNRPGLGASFDINTTGQAQVRMSPGVFFIAAGDGPSSRATASLSSNGLGVSGNRIFTDSTANIESGAKLVAATAMESASAAVTGAISCGSFTSSGAISGTTITGSGTVTGSSLSTAGSAAMGSISNSGNYTGNGFPTIAANTVTGTTTFAPNVFISGTTGNMARNTTMSERRAKENIEPLDFSTEAFIAVNPVTFNYKREAVSDDEQAEALNLGFILDDFEDAGLGELLVAEPFEGDEYKQLRYNLLYMYLHKVVQEQHSTIKDLTARLEALESR